MWRRPKWKSALSVPFKQKRSVVKGEIAHRTCELAIRDCTVRFFYRRYTVL
jgi:hypothetical protein